MYFDIFAQWDHQHVLGQCSYAAITNYLVACCEGALVCLLKNKHDFSLRMETLEQFYSVSNKGTQSLTKETRSLSGTPVKLNHQGNPYNLFALKLTELDKFLAAQYILCKVTTQQFCLPHNQRRLK